MRPSVLQVYNIKKTKQMFSQAEQPFAVDHQGGGIDILCLQNKHDVISKARSQRKTRAVTSPAD